jgi:uncharacterized repeat protein (TIGR03803 family)
VKRTRILTLICGLVLGLCLALFLGPTVQAQHLQPKQLFAFACNRDSNNTCQDGGKPAALIQSSDGSFYGVAQVSALMGSPRGGSIFKIGGGKFKLLFTFSPDRSGSFPHGSVPSALIEGKDGFLYGTTLMGGATNDGVLFKLSKTGSGFQVLHSFCGLANCADGSTPISLIRGKDSNLYGTTHAGPTDTQFCATTGCGTIFRFTLKGNLAILHTFGADAGGFQPSALIQGTDGNFYGTDMGGTNVMAGTVFRVSPRGKFSILHNFAIYKAPLSGLAQVSNGDLFGIFFDAAHSREQQLFKVSSSGNGYEEFPGFAPTSGAVVFPSLIQASDGNLWGTVFNGGSGQGSIIALSPNDGSVQQDISFDGADGQGPGAPLLQGADRKIYGTALSGGTVAQGKVAGGVVFSLDAGLKSQEAK